MSPLRQACTLCGLSNTQWQWEPPEGKKAAVSLELQLTAFTGYSMSPACTLSVLTNPFLLHAGRPLSGRRQQARRQR